MDIIRSSTTGSAPNGVTHLAHHVLTSYVPPALGDGHHALAHEPRRKHPEPVLVPREPAPPEQVPEELPLPRKYTQARGHRGGVEAPRALAELEEGRERVRGCGDRAREGGVRGGEEQRELGAVAPAGDGELELLGGVEQAPHGERGVGVERVACVDEAAEAREDGARGHGGDEVAVGPELGLVFFVVIVVAGWGLGAGVLVERGVPAERIEAPWTLQFRLQ